MKNRFILFAAIIFILASCSNDNTETEPPVPIPDTYELPVVFHIMYADESSEIQNVPSDIIDNIIEQTNDFLKNTETSIDMKVKLIPATTDPSGKALDEKGIHRIMRSDANELKCDSFMYSKKAEDIAITWDPNKYLNIFVYSFSEKNVVGIAHLPYTPTSNSLAGLNASDYYYNKPMNNVWGISLNNKNFYDFSPNGEFYVFNDEAFNTLTHELGHYLGLFHVFSEKDCSETDYCDDTPNYNREEYESFVNELWEKNNDEYTWENLVKRTGCDGESFISHNVMDYDFSFFDTYTKDQRTRTRHVLENSPLVPGPKQPRTTTRSAILDDEPPIVTIRCIKHNH